MADLGQPSGRYSTLSVCTTRLARLQAWRSFTSSRRLVSIRPHEGHSSGPVILFSTLTKALSSLGALDADRVTQCGRVCCIIRKSLITVSVLTFISYRGPGLYSGHSFLEKPLSVDLIVDSSPGSAQPVAQHRPPPPQRSLLDRLEPGGRALVKG